MSIENTIKPQNHQVKWPISLEMLNAIFISIAHINFILVHDDFSIFIRSKSHELKTKRTAYNSAELYPIHLAKCENFKMAARTLNVMRWFPFDIKVVLRWNGNGGWVA